MAQEGYQIVHSIAGRIRIRVSWFETDPQATSNYQRLVEALNGVRSARINSMAQSIVVEYDPRAMSIVQAGELLIATMQQVKLTPPADAPIVEEKVDPETKPPESQPAQSSTEPPSEPPKPPKPQSDTKQPSVVEIPSPWDEDLSEPNKIEELLELLIEEDPTDAIAQPVPKFSNQVYSTSSLADRLNVTSQAITRRRGKSDFGKWTQAQDPEGIAWNYHADDRVFRPVVLDTET